MILWAHGLEGSPDGNKVQALRAAGFEVVAPDGRGKVLADRLVDLDAASARLAEQAGAAGTALPLLAGSSYGGLAAAWLATEHPERFCGVLLLAPALHHHEPPARRPLVAPSGLPVYVIHGNKDWVVPLSASQDYVERSRKQGVDVTLEVVTDAHPLADSIDRIVAAAERLGGR